MNKSLLSEDEKVARINYLVNEIIECGRNAFKCLEENPDAKDAIQWIVDRCVDSSSCLEVEGLLDKAFEMYPMDQETIKNYLLIYHARQEDSTYKGPSSFDACHCDGEEHERY